VKINTIRKKIQADEYVFTLHADTERKADDLTFHEIEQAILNGEVLERYDDTGRGESCLIVGFAGETPIHVVCGWRGDKVAIITVYVPKPPKFVDPWTREEKE
jgi:signal recognition particle GTPase